MSTIFANLPEDIIRYILSYSGVIKYRAGKYMSQFQPNDNRYMLLHLMPVPRYRYNPYNPNFLIITITFTEYRKIHSLTINVDRHKSIRYIFSSLVQCYNCNNTYIRY